MESVKEKNENLAKEMSRVNQICSHPLWKACTERIELLEKDRVYCGHDTEHFLAVARLAWIENLENQCMIPKEIIYAAALLHDIGRHLQYEQGIPHEEGSAQLAAEILPDCGFDREEQQMILEAISGHRNKATMGEEGLSGLIYRADKRSRMCLFCKAEKDCNWSREKKNMQIIM